MAVDIDDQRDPEGYFTALPYIVFGSFIIMFFLIILFFQYGITNDYLFYDLQNVSETLVNVSAMDQNYADLTQIFFDSYRTSFPVIFDWTFICVYSCFVISSLVFTYRMKAVNYFAMFVYLFYGLMITLFAGGIALILTEWLRDEILLKVLPNALSLTPMFNFFVRNAGIFVLIHSLACLGANVFDFDLSKIGIRKKKEQDVFDDEVL